VTQGSLLSGSSPAWTTRDADLTAYAGETIRIGFIIGIGISGSGFPGWYIDDIEILMF
jgi:hypothetical protein